MTQKCTRLGLIPLFIFFSAISIKSPELWARPRALFNESRTTPEQIVEKSKKGRVEFSDTMFELKDLYNALDKKEDLIPYVRILDQLQQIETSLNFSVFDASPFADTAASMAVKSIPFSDISQDPVEFTEMILKWFPEDVAPLFFKRQKFLLDEMIRQDQLDSAFLASIKMVYFLENLTIQREKDHKNERRSYFINEEAAQLVGLILEKIHRLFGKTLDTAGYEKYIQLIPVRASMESFVKELQHQVLSAKNTDDVTYILNLSPVLFARYKALSQDRAIEYENPVGDMVLNVLTKLMFSKNEVPEGSIKKALSTLNAEQVLSLGGRISHLEPTVYPSHKIEFLSFVGNHLLPRYYDYGLFYEANELSKGLERLNRLGFIYKNEYEGIFSLTTEEGEKGVLTILRYESAEIGATFKLGETQTNFAYAQYLPKEHVWEFSNVRLVDNRTKEGSTVSRRLRLKFVGSNKTFKGSSIINGMSTSFEGRKLISAINFADYQNLDKKESFAGTYDGSLKGSSIETKKCTLIIQESSMDDFMATLSFPNGGSPISATFVSTLNNPDKGAILLNQTNVPAETPMVQLRGQIKNGVFTGQYLIGGRTEAFSFSMKRRSP